MDPTRNTIEDDENNFPTKIKNKTYNCFTTIINAPEKGITYTDQTGAFPYQSSRGNKYIFICYNYDANAILCEPLKNRTGETISKAWTTCFNRLTKNGHNTELFILDNEISPEVKSAMDKAQVNYQLVPPGIHRRNAAERAIQTFKNHF